MASTVNCEHFRWGLSWSRAPIRRQKPVLGASGEGAKMGNSTENHHQQGAGMIPREVAPRPTNEAEPAARWMTALAELGRLVDEQDATMTQVDLAGPGPLPPPLARHRMSTANLD